MFAALFSQGRRNFYDIPYDVEQYMYNKQKAREAAARAAEEEAEAAAAEAAEKEAEAEAARAEAARAEAEAAKAKVLYEAAEGRREPDGLSDSERVLWRSFCTADLNSNGALSKRELIEALEREGSSDVKEALRGFLELDENANGKMEWGEFKALALKLPALNDLMRSMSRDDRRNLAFDGAERHEDDSIRTRREQLAYAGTASVSGWEAHAPLAPSPLPGGP